MLVALVHTQGVVLGSKYIPLEMAYVDILRMQAHFHITSPISFTAMRKFFPHSRSDVTMITEGGISYAQVLAFLNQRFHYLNALFPQSTGSFGCKGTTYQTQILKDAGISNIINVETLGVPALRHARVDTITDLTAYCPWHIGRRWNKCAKVALNRILHHIGGGGGGGGQ